MGYLWTKYQLVHFSDLVPRGLGRVALTVFSHSGSYAVPFRVLSRKKSVSVSMLFYNWHLLGVKKIQAHETGSWYHLGVLLKIFD